MAIVRQFIKALLHNGNMGYATFRYQDIWAPAVGLNLCYVAFCQVHDPRFMWELFMWELLIVALYKSTIMMMIVNLLLFICPEILIFRPTK